MASWRPGTTVVVCFSGALGVVACSADGCRMGARWTVASSEGSSHASPVLAMVFVDERRGWAATPSGLLESSDGGSNWRPSSEYGRMAVGSVMFVDASRGWAVGAEVGKRDVGLVLRTLDGGQHWVRYEVGARGGLLTASFCDKDRGWAISSEEVLATVDGGAHWERKWEAPAERSLISVACQDPQSAWVAGSAGRLMHTGDGGAAWEARATGTHGNLYRIRVFDGRVWVVGETGTVICGDKEGAELRAVRTNSRASLLDIWMSGHDGWLVGSEGTILRTRDGGSTWEPFVSPTSLDLVSLFFLRPNLGWAAGRSMTVLRWRW